MKDNKIYVLDTSALLTYIENEDGSEFVEELLAAAEEKKVVVYLSFISLTEVFYITAKERDESEAFRRINLIQSLDIIVLDSNENINLKAGKFKATNRISLADAFICALRQEVNGILVHKDPEFEDVLPPIIDHKLPYKTLQK